MTILITDISAHPALEPVRYRGAGFVTKAGMLPFYHDAGGVAHFLVAAPKPKNNPGDTLPFALARGTRQMREASGDWVDIRSAEQVALAASGAAEVEAAHQAAIREAEEELGLPETAIQRLYDAGVLAYKDYGIHFFAGQVEEGVPLLPATDSAAVRWVTLAHAMEMEAKGAFSPRYLPLLSALAAALNGA